MNEAHPQTADIGFQVERGIAFVTLNRPKALNALTLEMIQAIASRLSRWASDPAVHAVVIQGEGERAFCAGGDVRAVYDSVKAAPSDLHRAFFVDEYRLNRAIHRFPKPYIALIDGITMGGGMGLSVHGGIRVATERTLSAMPETGIGLFPDIGATWFLNRCPGRLGLYLALTGARLRGADVLYAGIATDFVESGRLAELKRALGEADWSRDPSETASTTVRRFAGSPGEAALRQHESAIDRAFAGDSVEAILAELAGLKTEWANATLATLAGKSPTSLKLTLEQLRRGKTLSIEAALIMEFRMVQRCMAGHDFFEGIRALLVDKDLKPVWRPQHLEEVRAADIEAYFAPLGAADLRFD
ncbi:MAG: enoyl-CoA hydratase/isomerase family protein [Proteobacteria bacterium]|nr:enoyl-CoA hydratase/isomerase family protein [Pseudomonadota bacterium]MBI3499876.1 enoyl-CoA hydratase/isomerase family protein [Pseudomonadota bacterium]